MNFIKKFSPLVMGFMLLVSAAFAQGQQNEPITVTDTELEKMIGLIDDAQAIQEESQQKMQKMVQEEGLEIQRFQMIMLSKQNPQVADSVEVTEEEEEAIENLQPKLTQMNQMVQQEFIAAVEDNGLTQQRYKQIGQALQTNPELAQRFQKMRTEMQNGSEGDG